MELFYDIIIGSLAGIFVFLAGKYIGRDLLLRKLEKFMIKDDKSRQEIIDLAKNLIINNERVILWSTTHFEDHEELLEKD